MLLHDLPLTLTSAQASLAADASGLGPIGLMIGVLVVIMVFWWVIGSVFMLWFQALASNAPVGLFSLLFMRIRKVNPTVIVTCRITAKKAGIDISADKLEAHYMAGGHVVRVTNALIAANKANIALTFDRACAIDLAGRDVLDAVQTSVGPKVIDVPAAGSGLATIDGVAQNGIQLKVKARVTVRTNLDRLVGGAVEMTIIARVGQGIVSAIGASKTHMDVLENPKSISKAVLDNGLDAGTAFEILSIDIADVIVGENIGARLQTDQAEAQKVIAQAEAEQRRAMAVAREQEMIAQVAENRAKVVLAESEIPLAIAEAFRKGNLGIMDYYQLKNVQADTAMRDSIAAPGPTPQHKS
jgi:uncharacterized protein YqfA (UPF0365 family)